MRALNRLALVAGAASLALALAACGSDAPAGDEAALAGKPVAPVAAPAGTDWNDQVTRTADGGWLVGNPQAPIRLVEFGSLTCPACAAFSVGGGGTKLHTDYIATGRVNYELRSVLIHGVVDLLLTRLLECGTTQAAVPQAHQLWTNLETVVGQAQANQAALEQAADLPENHRYVAMAKAAGLIDYFAARGLSTEQSRVCLADAAAVQKLAEKTQEVATTSKVNSTPTFFLNDNRLDGTSWAAVEAALQAAGAR